LAAGLFWVIGAAAYFLPVLLAAVGARSFARRELNVTLRTAGASLGALVFLSGLLDLEMIGVPTLSSGFIQKGMAGGLTGQALADTLSGFFASTGAHILVVSGLLIAVLFAIPISLVDLWQRLEHGWISLAESVAAMLPERRTSPDRSKKAKVKPLKINRS